MLNIEYCLDYINYLTSLLYLHNLSTGRNYCYKINAYEKIVDSYSTDEEADSRGKRTNSFSHKPLLLHVPQHSASFEHKSPSGAHDQTSSLSNWHPVPLAQLFFNSSGEQSRVLSPGILLQKSRASAKVPLLQVPAYFDLAKRFES